MQKKNADKTPAERLLLRLYVGAVALQHNPLYYVALLVSLVLVVLLGSPLHGAPPDDLFTSLAAGLHRTLYPLYAIAGLLACIVLFGYPHGARKASRALARAGIVNSSGKPPCCSFAARIVLIHACCAMNSTPPICPYPIGRITKPK